MVCRWKMLRHERNPTPKERLRKCKMYVADLSRVCSKYTVQVSYNVCEPLESTRDISRTYPDINIHPNNFTLSPANSFDKNACRTKIRRSVKFCSIVNIQGTPCSQNLYKFLQVALGFRIVRCPTIRHLGNGRIVHIPVPHKCIYQRDPGVVVLPSGFWRPGVPRPTKHTSSGK